MNFRNAVLNFKKGYENISQDVSMKLKKHNLSLAKYLLKRGVKMSYLNSNNLYSQETSDDQKSKRFITKTYEAPNIIGLKEFLQIFVHDDIIKMDFVKANKLFCRLDDENDGKLEIELIIYAIDGTLDLTFSDLPEETVLDINEVRKRLFVFIINSKKNFGRVLETI